MIFLQNSDWLFSYFQGYQKYQARELKLMDEFFKLKEEVRFSPNFWNINLFQIHNALCDSIDTRTVMEKITKLVAIGNAYINEKVGIRNLILLKTMKNCAKLVNFQKYFFYGKF